MVIEGRATMQNQRRTLNSKVYSRLENVQDAMPNAK